MLAVVIPSFNSESCLVECIRSLKKGLGHKSIAIVVIENGFKELETRLVFQHLYPKILKESDRTQISIVQNSHNSGFASAVNLGITRAFQDPKISAVWILNPDCIAFHSTAIRFYEKSETNDFIGGRVLYQQPYGSIQMDSGYANSWTGVTGNVNLGNHFDSPKVTSTRQNSFPSGANMVISRRFFDYVGTLPEDNFLYYEEISWSKASYNLSRMIDIDAITLHDAGHSIGSRTLKNAPSRTASYFMNRSRLNFIRRYHSERVPFAYVYSIVRSIRSQLQFGRKSSFASILGSFGLAIPNDVKSKIQSR